MAWRFSASTSRAPELYGAAASSSAPAAAAQLPAVHSAAGLDLLYGGPVRECYAAPLFVVMLPPLLRGLMVRYDGC